MGAAKAKSKKKAKTAGKAKSKSKTTKIKRGTKKSGGPIDARPFRFTAADTVQIHFQDEKKPESFRVDDMVEATLVTPEGQTKLYFQYRLVSNDRQGPGNSDRYFWFFDPKPVGTADPIDPSLWQPTDRQTVDGQEVVASCSGAFSTKSVTGYDGSGTRHVVRLDDKPSYRMRLDLNGKHDFCESLQVTIRKGDVLSATQPVSGAFHSAAVCPAPPVP